MEAKELRIGNLINHEKHGIVSVLGITPYCGDYKIDTEKGWVYLKNCRSIPLSEEWLLKLGSNKVKEIVFAYSRFKLIFKQNYNYWYVLDLNDSTYLTKIEFVHEWQNFVSVMNGEDLKVKTHLETL